MGFNSGFKGLISVKCLGKLCVYYADSYKSHYAFHITSASHNLAAPKK